MYLQIVTELCAQAKQQNQLLPVIPRYHQGPSWFSA